LPRLVGVVCGADAAVRADIESVAAARFGGYPIRFVEVGVSGPGAAESVASGLRTLLADAQVDVVVLARGGGDSAQLLPFSDEELCRAICRAGVPVVTAIGHDRDRPLCDEVADLRCATPSLAAAAVIPSRAELDDRLVRLRRGLDDGLGAHLDRATARVAAADPAGALAAASSFAEAQLTHAGARLHLVAPAARVAQSLRLLERIDRRSGVVLSVHRARNQLQDRRSTLDALDPTRVLARGYAVVRRGDGVVVRDASGVAVDEEVHVEVARGRLTAAVTAVHPEGRA
ncbi:MAG TPA: exodeoxyribonuclease VII large subunit, partial [Acidimicrobiales bacterium]|nr:exodeoxyribonuclease VII large subunit [Acidimicrobiales bacterium]